MFTGEGGAIDPADIFSHAKRIGVDAFFTEVHDSVKKGLEEHEYELRKLSKSKALGMAAGYQSDGKILLGNNRYSFSHLYIAYAMFIQGEVVISYAINNPGLSYMPITVATRSTFATAVNGAGTYWQLLQHYNTLKNKG